MFRKKVKTLLASAAAAGVFVAMSATGANAMTKSEYTSVCQTNYSTGWYAEYVYNTGAYGWRCRTTPFTEYRGLNIEHYCNVVYGNHARLTNASDPYGWYCGA